MTQTKLATDIKASDSLAKRTIFDSIILYVRCMFYCCFVLIARGHFPWLTEALLDQFPINHRHHTIHVLG